MDPLRAFDSPETWLLMERVKALETPPTWLEIVDPRALVELAREFEKDAALEAMAPAR